MGKEAIAEIVRKAESLSDKPEEMEAFGQEVTRASSGTRPFMWVASWTSGAGDTSSIPGRERRPSPLQERFSKAKIGGQGLRKIGFRPFWKNWGTPSWMP